MYPTIAFEHRELLEKVSHMGDFGAWQKREFSVFYDALASLRREWQSVGLSSKHCFSKGFEILPDLLESLVLRMFLNQKISEDLENQRLRIESNQILRTGGSLPDLVSINGNLIKQ